MAVRSGRAECVEALLDAGYNASGDGAKILPKSERTGAFEDPIISSWVALAACAGDFKTFKTL